MFYHYPGLQHSQTVSFPVFIELQFYHYPGLQHSQTGKTYRGGPEGFTTIQDYNTLKQVGEQQEGEKGFTTIQDYNTLKPQIAFSCRGSLQVYPLTPGGVIPGRV